MSERRPPTIIRARPKAGVLMGLALSAVFAAVMAPIATVDTWMLSSAELGYGEPAPFTIRVPHFGGLRARDETPVVSAGSVVVTRGEPLARAHQEIIFAIRQRTGDPMTTTLACAAAFALLALMYSAYLRRSPRGKLLRTQAVTLALIAVFALVLKLALMLTPVSVFLVPVGGAAICAALAVNSSAGLATALVVAAAMGLTAPFSLGVIGVLGIQGLAMVLAIGDGHRKLVLLVAGLVGGLFAAMAYASFYFLSHQQAPVNELLDPLSSAWLAALAGGLVSGVAGILALPLYQALLGEITRGKLIELSDLSNPLLRQISERSPGTWQHSLAMANMAEIAANTIGADGRLVRVGAYYHDLGKSLQPKYFIENLPAGEPSPHDALAPHVSADAIFAHVTEGVRLGRKEGLPERVIDFMHMHHGDGLLEYFWDKCVRRGNERGLSADDFRYPGVRPQTRETAVLAIVDAVEAASRTLKSPDARAIENLVQRIVYGKLHLGQLDDSGLSMADLRRLSNSLIETIKHAHHVRIEYPWQKAEREAATAETVPVGAAGAVTAAATPKARQQAGNEPGATTNRVLQEPPLDSLDVPRPLWRARPTPQPPTQQPLTPPPTTPIPTTPIPTTPIPTTPIPTTPIPADALAATAALGAVDAPREAQSAPTPPGAVTPMTDASETAAARSAASRETMPAPAPAEPDEPTIPGAGATRGAIPEPAAGGATSDAHRTPTRELPVTTPTDHQGGRDERSRKPPKTIPLMAEDPASGPLANPSYEVESHRAESADTSLEPGTLVVGAPPSTHGRALTRGGTRRTVGNGNDGQP